ncbi:hypothetical protein J007_03500 [Cryptococcus neoformans]|nr:hypothetical protein C356_03557 [Cryptococcus neoformans var. grubii c45]OXB36764.1 hypothetical protein J007_03500 [Cryptococcus neoformans var. grubii]OXC60970.1 hypothetical protein C358_03596 [Cryptococcus neoformans var. grubii MW-RSA852]
MVSTDPSLSSLSSSALEIQQFPCSLLNAIKRSVLSCFNSRSRWATADK